MDYIENVSGTDITINDSNGDKIVDYDLVGRLEQVSTTGKNMFNPSDIQTYTKYGIYYIFYELPNAYKTKITASAYLSDTLKGLQAGLSDVMFSAGNSQLRIVNSGVPTNKTYDFTNSEHVYFFIGDGAGINGKETGDTNAILTNYNIQVELGESVTDYEPYSGGAPSPSPDFPQEINVVTGNIGVESCGKNLFDVSFFTTKSKQWAGYTSQGSSFRVIPYYIGAGNYMSFSSNVPSETSSVIYAFDTTGYLSGSANKINVTTPRTIKALEDGYVYLGFVNNRLHFDEIEDGTYWVMINKGETVAPYEPYQGNEYSIVLTKNKADYSLFKTGYVTSSGINTSHTMGEMYSYFIKVKPNTTYTFSIQETSSTYNNWFGVGEYGSCSQEDYIKRDTSYVESQNYITFTTSATTNYVRLSARNLIAATKIQFEEGNQVTTYQPYLELGALGDYQDYIIRSSGKNLLSPNFSDYNITDGTYGYIKISDIEEDLMLSVSVKDSSIDVTRTYLGFSTTGKDASQGVSWVALNTLSSRISNSVNYQSVISKAKYISFYPKNETTFNKLFSRFNIMVEKGTTATTYEPYGKGKWYIHKEIGKDVYNGSETWSTENNNVYRAISDAKGSLSQILSNYFEGITTTSVTSWGNVRFGASNKNIIFLNALASQGNVNGWKTWLSTHNTIVYYVLATPTTTEITDETLLSQLNNMRNMKLLYGLTYIQTTGDIPPTLSLDYYTWDRRISPDDRQALIDNTATIPYRINIIKDGNIIKTLDEHSIVNINYEDFRYVDSDSLIVGQFVARKVTGTLDQIYTDFEIEDTEIELQMGVSYNNTTTYYSLGNFLVTKPTTDDVKDKTTFEALDYTKKFNQKFDATDLTFPCTALDLAKYVCEQCGVELGDELFTNNDFVILNNQYTEGESCRKVMQDIGKLAYSWVRIDWDNKCYIDFEVDNTINDKNIIPSNKYYTLNKQEFVYGPINRVVVGMKDVEGENVILEDAESISQNGANELRVYDNNLTYTPELRNQVIEAASKLFGLAYTPLETITVGHPWLLGNERIKLTDNDENETYTYAFDRTIEYQGHIKTKLTSKGDTKTETEYKNTGGLETDVRKTRIIVDKNTGDITSLTSRTNTISDQLNNTYTIQEVNELVQNAETGVTNTFSTSGGNNIFRNTGLWFETNDNNNPYEFWSGVANWTSDSRAVNLRAIVLKNTTFSQQQSVPNGTYTISFKYEKNIVLANVKVVINDIEYTLSNNDFSQTIQVTSQSIKLDFVCDIDDACIVYDLMVNSGDVKLAYTQNENETTTDTVNISKGITITSSSSDVTFKANADGIRTIDRNNTELTTFTDKGMKTKEAEITGKSQIVGILFQEVGDQTWLTKL